MSSTPLTDTLQETLAIFEEGGEPRTTTEVAEQFDLGRRSAYERLERLVDHDQLETKKVGGNGRVWWQPATDGDATTRDAVDSDLGEVFDRISDSFYALDEELRFRYLNDTAVDLFGLDETAIGSDIRNGNLTETFENALCEALETKELVTFEDYYPPWDKWFHNAIYPSESGLSVFTRDITERKRREQELARYETVVETSPIGITIVGSDGEMRFANNRAEEIYGRSKDQVNTLSFDDSEWKEIDADGEPLTRDENPFPRIMESEEPLFDQISGVSRPDGERIWISVNGAPVYNDRGEIESVVFSIEDITERREQQRTLEESERRYRTLVENFPNGIVTQFDEELRYTLAEGQAFDYLPHSPDDVEGNHLHEVWADDVAETIEPVYRVALEGEKQSIEGRSEGREWILHVVPLSDQDGEIHGGMTIALDITERKERERALEESERRYRTLVENFPNGAVGLFDDDLRYTAIGGEFLDVVGVAPEDRIGNSVYDIYADDIVEEIEPYFEAALEGEANSFELEYLDRNLFVYSVPVRNADDEVYAGMIVVQDVTERRKYQRKLEASNERLEQFAYAVSHDLQEPLRMVTSYLQLLDQRYGDALEDDGEEFLEFAVDGAERMREMIEGLLEYSRVETRGEPFEPVDLDAILDEVRDDLQLRIDETDAEISADDLPTVVGDPSQLRQVFQNLLDNAIEYSGDEPPRVDITAERADSRWRITVHDHGIGIDSDNQDRVFEVFQRLHTSDEHPGTGIGLALCQRIVERHDGELWVESEPGEGSTFSFTLPVS
ncbi:PAS domain-containing protein [Natronorubrum sediminis]|nr:PAS domain-containing protein [Natronorubrum sediminis]